MPLSAIPKYLRTETRRLFDSALEQAWQELKEDVPADIALARRSWPGRSSLLRRLVRPIQRNLNGSLVCVLVHWGTARKAAYATTFAKRRTPYARRT
jgi:hypothetical protein